MAEGWARHAPDDELVLRPMSDGGPGFVEVVAEATDAELLDIPTTGPLGQDVTATIAMVDDTAYIEAAQACGLQLVPGKVRNPGHTTCFGVGQLIAAAVDAGASRIVVGLGGSATNDGGAGMLAALGAVADGPLDAGGGPLRTLTRVDIEAAREAVAGVELIAASDVDNPLLGMRGATRIFAPQKGATPEQVETLEAALGNFAELVGRAPNGKDPALAAGAGAAGGLGYALAQLGARRAPGITTVAEIVGLPTLTAQADLVITGEGRFDWQSLHGKVVSGVAAIALDRARPCIVLAGEVIVGRRDYSAIGVTGAYSASDTVGSVAQSMAQPAEALAATAERVARTWSRRNSST